MFSQESFFQRSGLSAKDVGNAQITFSELQAIYSDFSSRQESLGDAVASLLRDLNRSRKAHFTKSRVKNPYRVLEKVVRKRIKDPKRDINLATYMLELTDLAGVRVLHLVKSDWPEIHHHLKAKWTITEGPVANIREGDETALYEEYGCKIDQRKGGYRSVHYVVKVPYANENFLIEVQMRTLFEEAWSEIDHRFRYSNPQPDPMIEKLLLTFNRMSGSADELGDLLSSFESTIDHSNKQWGQLKDLLQEKGVWDVATDKLITKLSADPLGDAIRRFQPFAEFFGPMMPKEKAAFDRALAKNRQVQCKANLKDLATALEMWSSDNGGKYPDSLAELPEGRYMKAVPTCPGCETGGEYHYERLPTEKYDEFRVNCVGERHKLTDTPPDYPRYTSWEGLRERPREQESDPSTEADEEQGSA